MQNHLNYKPWIWLELIGFDILQPDRGAKEYLERLGFIPPAISLLITSPDIIHYHQGLTEKVLFPADYCSYCGHPRNSERERQQWSNIDLKALIDALHSHGVKVYLATFTFFLNNTFSSEWVNDHRELLEVRKNAQAINALMPLKRFATGEFYEDFLTEKLVSAIADYGFDGWHAADGWGPARLPISEADFSDDMVGQFVEAQRIDIPQYISLKCDGNANTTQKRANWIWNDCRRQWIDFYTDRWATFHHKQANALAAIGKNVVINSAWTRDPFEAIYRYGVDYQKIINAGVKGIITESAAAASDMEAESDFRLFNYTASLMLIKASVPNAEILFLNGVKDTKEQWDLIHHAPTVYEREILTLSNIYFQKSDSYERCADGFVVCLGDGIKQNEWQWLKNNWDLAFERLPQQVSGPTIIWSEIALQNEIDHFIANRFPTTHYFIHELLQRNAPLSTIARIENLENVTGPIVLFNSHLFPESELQKARAYANDEVIEIGMDSDRQFKIRLLSSLNKSHQENQDITVNQEIIDTVNISEPVTFLDHLPMKGITETDLNRIAKMIRETTLSPEVTENKKNIQLTTLKITQNKWRLIIHNDHLAYSRPEIDMHLPIEKIDVLTEFPSTIIESNRSKFVIKVPGRGAVVLDVLTQTPDNG